LIFTESGIKENIEEIVSTGIARSMVGTEVGYENVDAMYEHLSNDLLIYIEKPT